MTGKTRAGFLVLLTIGLASLIWFLRNDDNAATLKPDSLSTAVDVGVTNEEAPEASGAAVEENAESNATAEQPEAAQAIAREDVVGKLRLVGPDGKAAGGRVELVKVNETFNTYFSTMARIGQAIYFDSIVQEAEVAAADGLLNVTSEGNRADFVIVLAPGFTPYLDTWKPITSDDGAVLELTPALPIAVTVLTSDGQPIQDAQVWYRWTGTFNQNENAPLLERFRSRFFQEVEVTNEQGLAVLTSTFPEWSTELFIRPGDLWATTVQSAEAGKPVEIRCPDAFMATGFVTVNGQVPEQEVQLKATIHQGDQYWMLESGRAKEAGKYKITGIPTGYPAYQIEAMGNGLANLTQDIFAPEPGSTVHLDFAMKEGHGGSVLLKDPWGEPISNGRLKFVAEGNRSHMYGYNSDAAGLVELPSAFRKGEAWWLNLRIGDTLYLRLSEPFQVGTSMEISVPNLARISSIELPKELLGDASLTSATWTGRSSQSWGSAAWTPDTATTTLLASGSANLSIELSDGRTFQQSVVLAPGSNDSVAVALEATTLSFELPESPPAFVSIATQDGVTVYENDALSGAASIPLWQGRYSFVAIWPEAAREISLITLAGTDVDLGKIEAATAGYIEGRVQDASGNPVQWANVYLTAVNGYSSQSWGTEQDGLFAFFDVPLGKYFILCTTADSHASQSASVMESITITADQLNHQINLTLPVGPNSQVRLTCANNWTFNSYAILATAHASSHAEVQSQGLALLSAQQQNGWLGAAQILDGKIHAQAKLVPSGAGEYTLSATAMRATNLLFVDEFGQPWKHLLLRLKLSGHPLTRRPTLDSTGGLEVRSNSDAPWSLQVCAPSGQVFDFDLSTLNNSETLIIPREISGHEVVVQSEAGAFIPWPTLQSADGSMIFASDNIGRAIIPTDFTAPLVASAKGFLPCWISNPRTKVITLPRRLSGVQMQLPSATTRLNWTHDSSFESIWPSEINVTPEQGTVTLPPLHAAHFTFFAYRADGTPIAERKFVLREEGQVLRWK